MTAAAKPPLKSIDPARLQECWRKALQVWGLAIQVDTPVLDAETEAIAFIDLETRRVVLNPNRIASLDALDSLEAILAHELGHHFRYPGSLAVQARLELLERELLPIHGYSLLNLFSDYLINTELGKDRRLQKQLAAVYTGTKYPAAAAKQDPSFFFYLTCFEEAWALEPHALTAAAGAALEEMFPGVRAEAQLLAQELPNLAPNLFTQFIYFASVVSRYQLIDADAEKYSEGRSQNPNHGDHSKPSAGDYADALERSAAESEAIRRAIKEGWLKPDKIPDSAASGAARGSALPGVLAGEPKKLVEAMALQYRRLAERYLMKLPQKKTAGDPIVPSTLSPWEVGDSPKEIDWLSSILAGGAELGVAQPLKRDWIEDDPTESRRDWRVRLEIYLDVSGSMPDPKASINPMTLAAQVLCMSAIRGGGQVRGLIYSTNNLSHWEWTRSELEISKFLMSYIGGGTDFPFAILKSSVRDCGRDQPVRVVLTDSDFHYNLKTGQNATVLKSASERSPVIVMLNGFDGSEKAMLAPMIDAGARCIPVRDMKSFPAVAAKLGEALFGEGAERPRVAPKSPAPPGTKR